MAFADEEGTRFGTAFLGSSVLAGRFEAADLERVDTEGAWLLSYDAIGEYGAIPPASMSPPAPPGAYVEVHIEQGPVLDEGDVALGVVSAISGQTRAALRFGVAGHAGTVPIELRHDAPPPSWCWRRRRWPVRPSRWSPRSGGSRCCPARRM